MEYVLVGDDCDGCRYVMDAFTLLKLPLKKLGIEALSPKSKTAIHALFACKNVEEKHKKQIHDFSQSNAISLISFLNPNTTKSMAPIHYLKIPFSEYELKDVLAHCKHPEDYFTELNHPIFEKLIGPSQQIRKIRSLIKQVSYSNTTVLILGPSGTGKDVIASCIHYLSDRRDKPLVPINCGAIPSELMESELFGHEKGAFTGASNRRPGRFEMANLGTLFLDEIGDMPLHMQVKLLRVIQERKIERVGSTSSIDVDVRLIAATNSCLEKRIQQNLFREDLYYRLNVFPIVVPSLHERAEDIPLLIDYHLDKIYDRLKHRVAFSEKAKEALCHYTWPGNIRELQNFLERMVILYPDQIVTEKEIDLPQGHAHPITMPSLEMQHDVPFNLKEHMVKIEQALIETALQKTNGMVAMAAKYLSMSKATFIKKMKQYRLTASIHS